MSIAVLSSFKKKLKARLRNIVDAPKINVEELIIGKNVIIEPRVEISCKRLVLGDGVVIKAGTRIEMVDLVIGDYTVINNFCWFIGNRWCRIGHNCYFLDYSIVNSTGTALIGNGVGMGGQLWSHIYFGDTLEGCRFASHKPLVVEDDVWFVGHCIVSPITAKRRSMALAGSVVTKDMEENHVYAGVPAKDVTDHFGPQFQEVSPEDKKKRMQGYLEEFLEKNKPANNRIRIVEKINLAQREYSQFSLTERVYIKNLYPEEVKFMRFLSPIKAKFYPHPDTDWIARYYNERPQ